ncbi:hypothetical protein JCM19235_3384 [Vibrio maritimus]|uniref:Chloramphenicol acetyltransferase n=1 Tax=Vibrio maritimus TaxID=990268 RepID=A0A090SLW7_9VIBR|nr:hypothetical protein JCM19235_3384 [Vibrio maritimus]
MERKFIEIRDGYLLKDSDKSSYEKWSLSFFHDKEIISDPMLEMTIHLDITSILQNFRQYQSRSFDASFNAFLIWCLVKSASNQKEFRYRKIEGNWFLFEHLPVYIPIAIGGDARFGNMNLQPPTKMSLKQFLSHYREELNTILEGKSRPFEVEDSKLWGLSWFVGNLPNIDFSSLSLHKSNIPSGRPLFYFGKRKEVEGKVTIPMFISFDHSNLDPLLVSQFVSDFEDRLSMESKKLRLEL